MLCAHCATPVPDDARFCHSCGSMVSDAEGQAAATASMDASSFSHMEKLLREETAGEYTIQRLLGRGGMAVVYLAVEVQLARKVAIKVLPPELTFGHGVERFKREAKTAAALDHPHIIPIYRIASEGKLFWYAMKFLEGRSLEDLLKEKERLGLEETIDILDQVADALDYAHEHQVVHRDIKPANVMLDSRNRVVLTDFGIAKALTEGTLTASGSVIGTPYFMSPEQGMGKLVTGAADQYSVGVMAYRMLAGQVPFEGDSAIDILHKHCMLPPPALESAAPGLPRHVYRAVARSLAKQPEQRYPSVSAFVEALRRPGEDTGDISGEVATVIVSAAEVTGAGQAAADMTARPTQKMVQPPATKRRGLMLAAAAVVVALGGGGTWWALHRGAAAPSTAATRTQTDSTATAGTSAPVPSPAQPTTGTLAWTGIPAGAVVRVDGRRRSGDQATLAVGPHIVQVTADGYEVSTDTVNVKADSLTAFVFHGQRIAQRVTQRPTTPSRSAAPPPARTPTRSAPAAAATGMLRVAVSPWAIVYMDGVKVGQKARFIDTVSAGIGHLLRFEHEGYVTKDTTVRVRAGQTLTLRIRLTQVKP